MKILMTGGTGLIGCEIAKRLSARGDELVLLMRNPDANHELPFPAKCIRWSHSDEVPPEALENVDAVINLAGEPLADARWTDEKKKRIRDTRILSTAALIRAVRAHAPSIKVFVQGSATGFYGDRKDELLDFKSSKGSGFLADVVAEWEAEALKLNENLPPQARTIRLPIVRTSMVLARHGGALQKMLPFYRAQIAGKMGWRGDQWMSWIHLADIARLFIHAVDNDAVDGVLEGAAPEPVPNHEFTNVLCRELGVFENLAAPAGAVRLLYGEMASVVLDGQRVVPTGALESGFTFQYDTIEAALAEILKPLRGSMFEELSEQWIAKTPHELWAFFSDEKNLEVLSPNFLKLRLKAKSTPYLQEGTTIDYSLNLNGIPFGWRSRIDEWVPEKRFVDTQLGGPYAFWRHEHEFVPMAGGTLLRDRVQYRVPFGWLGAIVSGWKVHRDVAEIFAFRRKKIAEIFAN